MRTRIVASVLTVALVAVSANVAFACNACNKNNASAKAASTADGSCSYSKATATVATAPSGKGVVMAVPTGSSCSASKAARSTAAAGTGCDVCDEYAGCDERLTVAGAVTQVVPLKNGVMFVYTSDSPKNAHKIQVAVRHRNDRIVELVAAGTGVALCDGCDAMRGAMASGKLHREVVNVEGGSLTLVTSDDPAVVKAIQEVSGVTSTAAKS